MRDKDVTQGSCWKHTELERPMKTSRQILRFRDAFNSQDERASEGHCAFATSSEREQSFWETLGDPT